MTHFDEGDDVPVLSADALLALANFYDEKKSLDQAYQALPAAGGGSHVNIESFGEDWNLSQFWYTKETASRMASAVLQRATDQSHIAFISAPSVFIEAKRMKEEEGGISQPTLYLFEYDKRFQVYEEFTYYDFNHPLEVPSQLRRKFNYLICDPPFLSDHCHTQFALTVRHLARQWGDDNKSGARTTLLICTGERMGGLLKRLYSKLSLRPTSFKPDHRGGLQNEFRSYANFETDVWDLEDWDERHA